MIHCKSHLPINTIIDFFVTFTTSADKIHSLLQQPPSSSSTISNPIRRSLAKLYYGGLLRRAGIIDNLYDYGLYLKLYATVTMSILYNFTFDELLDKITQRTHCGNYFVITHID